MSQTSLQIFDGQFPDSPRRTPYLYLSSHKIGKSECDIEYTVTSWPVNADTSDHLRKMADDAEVYWRSWQEAQAPKVCPVTLDPIMQEVLASICPVPPVPEPVDVNPLMDALKELAS